MYKWWRLSDSKFDAINFKQERVDKFQLNTIFRKVELKMVLRTYVLFGGPMVSVF